MSIKYKLMQFLLLYHFKICEILPKLTSVFRVAKPNQVNQSLIFWALIVFFVESGLFYRFLYRDKRDKNRE